MTDDAEAVDDDDYELDSPLNSSSDLYEDQYLNPLQGHRVMIIHPGIVLDCLHRCYQRVPVHGVLSDMLCLLKLQFLDP